MSKLWQKNYSLDSLIESFTVGKDYLLDQEILPADCLASGAQVLQLEQMGILTRKEKEVLLSALRQVLQEFRNGSWSIQASDEDGHTALENRLTELCGEAGKKIHTGRSRNDQVITALRVFGRSALRDILEKATTLVRTLTDFALGHQGTPMPGRTHMQTAMPSSVGLWAGAWAEEIFDTLSLGLQVWNIGNQNPLGSAASYGVPLPLDRELTARLLGFPKVQNNVLYVNNSRGKWESMVLDFCDQLGLTYSKMAQDLILFSLPEFGYFELPAPLCSGSSIMPQKKNPDGLELLRAKSATLGSYAQNIKNIIRSLPSGYNRDFQETKEPFLRGLSLVQSMTAVVDLTIRELKVHPDRLRQGFTSEIFATDAAYELVLQGQPFREAYKNVGLHLDTLKDRDPVAALKSRTHTGASGNLGLDALAQATEEQATALKDRRKELQTAVESWAGTDVWILSGL